MGLPISTSNGRSREEGTPPSQDTTTTDLYDSPVTPAVLQLERFERSLREPQKLALLLRLLGPLQDAACLMLDCGSPTGALAFHLRAAGGDWTWATLSLDRTADLVELLAEPVTVVMPPLLPFPEGAFHRIAVLNPPRTLCEDAQFSQEVGRVLAPHGRLAVLSRNRDSTLLLRLLRERVVRRSGRPNSAPGWAPDEFCSVGELERFAWAAGLFPDTRGACSRFFSECVEEFRLTKRSETVGSVGRLLAALDYLIPSERGDTVAVAARKPETGSKPS